MGGSICDPIGGTKDGDATDAPSRFDGEDHEGLFEVGMGSGLGVNISVSPGTSSMGRVLSRPEPLGAFGTHHAGWRSRGPSTDETGMPDSEQFHIFGNRGAGWKRGGRARCRIRR